MARTCGIGGGVRRVRKNRPRRRSRVVWTGSNRLLARKGCKLQLYLTTIENPRPENVVRSLDYVSAMIDSAPFLIALTSNDERTLSLS